MSTETMNVAEALAGEIARVSAKLERWKGYCRDSPELAAGMRPAMLMMERSLAHATRAAGMDCAIAQQIAVQDLQGFDSDD